MKLIYMDYAAATPMDKKVIAAMRPYFSDRFYNPSATYLHAQNAHKDIETARAMVARWLGARSGEIIFTAGGTEANNLAINGIMTQYPDKNVVVSSVEHESVIKPAQKYNYKIAPVQANGLVDITKLKKLIDADTVLVSIMLANNEIGSVQPLREVAKTVKEIRQARHKTGNNRPLLLHTDACQAAAYLDLHINRLGVDLMTINSGKIYGPKQGGALFVKAGLVLKPQILGGGQEHGLRSGTENVAGSIGIATALDLVQSHRQKEVSRLQELQALFFNLLEAKIPGLLVNGTRTHRLPNNIHITIPGQDNERLMMELDQKGILCAEGSACSASSEEPSHVLKAIGLSDEEAQASLRFTMGRQTSENDVRYTVQTLASLL